MSKIGEHGKVRESPVRVKAVIVGTGFSGLGMAVKLKNMGIHDFVICEKATEVGGTWRDNSYPGAECDVPSPVYSFSFFRNPGWSKIFGQQREIFSYLQSTVQKFGLRPHINFGAEVTKAQYFDHDARWRVYLASGAIYECQFLILGTGGLSQPAFPKISGLNQFKGKLFHTARWRHDVNLKGLKVAVIGTGASAIQVVPAISSDVGQLHLFQRTPAWVLPKMDMSFSQGVQKLFARYGVVQDLLRAILYWFFEVRAVGLFFPRLGRLGQIQALRYLKSVVKDPSLREKLTPKYAIGCKRVLLSNDFYKAFRLPHVNLVTESILEMTPNGIKTSDGMEYEFDAIVCATGFQVAEQAVSFPVIAGDGTSLADRWSQFGAQAYRGTMVTGFPNMFLLMGPNTGLGHNSMVYMIESQIRYIVDSVMHVQKNEFLSLDVTPLAQQEYNEGIQKKFQKTVWSDGGCKSWYQNKEGRNFAIWPGFSFAFRRRLSQFDASAYQFVTAKGAVKPSETKVLTLPRAN